MSLNKITIPAAGKSKSFNMTGLSVMVLDSPSYSDISKAAKLSFNNPGSELPVIAGAVWPSDEGFFENVTITGTTESAGDTVTLLTVNNCLEAALNIPDTGTTKVIAGITFSITSTDTAQDIPELQLLNADGLLPSSIYVSASGNDIRYAFDVDPDQSGFGFLLKTDAVPLEIQGIDFIEKFRFISDVAATPGDLIIEGEY